jgi:hypothetical protein
MRRRREGKVARLYLALLLWPCSDRPPSHVFSVSATILNLDDPSMPKWEFHFLVGLLGEKLNKHVHDVELTKSCSGALGSGPLLPCRYVPQKQKDDDALSTLVKYEECFLSLFSIS